jgi:hypothetical protein
MSRITDPRRAERLARAILSDVMLYNTERVRVGIQADDLFDRLRPELDEARAFFESRVDPEVAAKTNAFDRRGGDTSFPGAPLDRRRARGAERSSGPSQPAGGRR